MMKKFRPGYPIGKDVPRERKILFWLLLALATLLFFAAPMAMRAQERSNTYYVAQFVGPDVATKATNAQAQCALNSLPCFVVFDAILSAWPQGTLPTRCATCTWIDYRKTGVSIAPFAGLGIAAISADVQAGADWCAKVNAADAVLGATAGEIWISQAAGTSACAVGVTLSDNHTLRFIQGGTFTLGTVNITPGNHAGLLCSSDSTIIAYTGAVYAMEMNTVDSPFVLGWCKFSLNSVAPLGAMRIRNTGNSFDTQATIQAMVVTNPITDTAGQSGLTLQADNSISSVYNNIVQIKTKGVDIGVKLFSLVNNQGPNGNTLFVQCNLQNICLDILDGTDTIAWVKALGGVNSPIGLQIGGTGAGNAAISNNEITMITEEGTGSTAVKLNTGAANNVIHGATNDITQFVDSSGNRTNSILFSTQWTAIPGILEAGACATQAVHDVFCASSALHAMTVSYNGGAFLLLAQTITASFTTTAATTDNVTVTGMTATGHCYLTPTNAGASGGIASVFISAKAANQITITHTATAGWTFDVNCTPQ